MCVLHVLLPLLGDAKGMKKYITELTTEDPENNAAVANSNCNKRPRGESPKNLTSNKRRRETKRRPTAKKPARKYNYKEVCSFTHVCTYTYR